MVVECVGGRAFYNHLIESQSFSGLLPWELWPSQVFLSLLQLNSFYPIFPTLWLQCSQSISLKPCPLLSKVLFVLYLM